MAGLASKTYDPSTAAPFRIEVAPSGRSKCRNPQCLVSPEKRTIRKGELRIGRYEASPTEELNGRLHGKLFPKWVHLSCCAPVILQEALDGYGGTIEGVPGFEELASGSNERCLDPPTEALTATRTILGLENNTTKDGDLKDKKAVAVAAVTVTEEHHASSKKKTTKATTKKKTSAKKASTKVNAKKKKNTAKKT